MKSNSWKKEWLVISHSDYDNTWSELTIPLTFKQASAFIHNARYLNRLEKGLVKLVTVIEFASLQKKVTWKHDAPFNPQFLGAQRPQACQDY
jgi:hypothetical protein